MASGWRSPKPQRDCPCEAGLGLGPPLLVALQQHHRRPPQLVPTPADQLAVLLLVLFELCPPRFRPGRLRPRLAMLLAMFGPAD